MMLTTKGRYAVMAMVDIAHYGVNKKAIALYEISARQDITLSYLEQLFSKLKKHKLVESLKGPGGGYLLSKPAKHISILSIINAVEESIQITRCHNTGKGCLTKSNTTCFTHALWDGLGKQISDYLSSTSLQDVCRTIK
jgi:Rrf2 family transcriptional regulator, iron-sulfur cluster assembly transcription factor